MEWSTRKLVCVGMFGVIALVVVCATLIFISHPEVLQRVTGSVVVDSSQMMGVSRPDVAGSGETQAVGSGTQDGSVDVQSLERNSRLKGVMGAQASTEIYFNVYWAGDAIRISDGNFSYSPKNKTWVDGMINVDFTDKPVSLGKGVTIKLPNEHFTLGSLENLGRVSENTVAFFGRGANSTGSGTSKFDVVITSVSPMVSVTLNMGNYEVMDTTPTVITPNDMGVVWSGWSGEVKAEWSEKNCVLTLTGEGGGDKTIPFEERGGIGAHIFGGCIRK